MFTTEVVEDMKSLSPGISALYVSLRVPCLGEAYEVILGPGSRPIRAVVLRDQPSRTKVGPVVYHCEGSY